MKDFNLVGCLTFVWLIVVAIVMYHYMTDPKCHFMLTSAGYAFVCDK